MNESEVADVCQRIYQKHKQVLDLIFEHRLDEQAAIIEMIKSLIGNDTNLKLKNIAKNGRC